MGMEETERNCVELLILFRNMNSECQQIHTVLSPHVGQYHPMIANAEFSVT